MEHGVLIDPVAIGRENALETYLGLARAVPEATTQLVDQCLYVTGPRELSFCNFAAGFDWTEFPERRLAWLVETGQKNSGFWVFCMDGDEPARLDSQLQARGFMMRQNLVQMIFEGSAHPKRSDMVVLEATVDGARDALCLFAARTFFTRTAERSQRRIAEATARSGHRLWGVWDEHGPVAAMMTSESFSAVGIYNLCVRTDQRHRGTGSAMVAHALSLAESANKPVVLQCDPNLSDWYAVQGFRAFGSVQAYTFSSSAWRDIL